MNAKRSSIAEPIDCRICLEEILENDVYVCPRNCKGRFHVTCITKSVKINASCPTCRQSIHPDSLMSLSQKVSWRAKDLFAELGLAVFVPALFKELVQLSEYDVQDPIAQFAASGLAVNILSQDPAGLDALGSDAILGAMALVSAASAIRLRLKEAIAPSVLRIATSASAGIMLAEKSYKLLLPTLVCGAAALSLTQPYDSYLSLREHFTSESVAILICGLAGNVFNKLLRNSPISRRSQQNALATMFLSATLGQRLLNVEGWKSSAFSVAMSGILNFFRPVR